MKARNDQKVFQLTEQIFTITKLNYQQKQFLTVVQFLAIRCWASIILAESSVHLCSVQVLNVEWIEVQNLQMASPQNCEKLYKRFAYNFTT